MSGVTRFSDDIERGKPSERIFRQDFLEFLGIKYVDVTGCKQFQVIDSDYLASVGLYEVKNYYDDDMIIIEPHTRHPNKDGWFYKCGADLLVYVSKKTRNMILVPFTNDFKIHVQGIWGGLQLHFNKHSFHNGAVWQSAFYRIPLDKIKGYYSKYKKI